MPGGGHIPGRCASAIGASQVEPTMRRIYEGTMREISGITEAASTGVPRENFSSAEIASHLTALADERATARGNQVLEHAAHELDSVGAYTPRAIDVQHALETIRNRHQAAQRSMLAEEARQLFRAGEIVPSSAQRELAEEQELSYRAYMARREAQAVGHTEYVNSTTTTTYTMSPYFVWETAVKPKQLFIRLRADSAYEGFDTEAMRKNLTLDKGIEFEFYFSRKDLEQILYDSHSIEGVIDEKLSALKQSLIIGILNDARLLVGKNDAYQQRKSQEEAQQKAESKDSPTD